MSPRERLAAFTEGLAIWGLPVALAERLSRLLRGDR